MNKLAILNNKIVDSKDLDSLLASWRANGEKIVFTNGCFDILHLGHVDYLAKAADLGTKLIIGLNTDASVSKQKGPSRPITNEVSRLSLLASLFFVDAVILFDEPTPIQLITSIKPNVLAKGADYEIKDIVGADYVFSYGGAVERIEFVEGYSTSAIEQKIKIGSAT